MTSMPWFRFWNETVNDRKIRHIAADTGLPKMLVLGAWSTLMALASESPERGHLLLTPSKPYTLDRIADEMDADLTMTSTLIQAFSEYGMISHDDGVYILCNWEKRQPSSDLSTPRVQRYRAQQMKRECNVSQPLPQRFGNAPELDLDLDPEAEAEADPPPPRETAGEPPAPGHSVAYDACLKASGGTMNGLMVDQLGAMIDDSETHRRSLPRGSPGADLDGDTWVAAAIRETNGAIGRFNLRYVESVLDRWRREGYQTQRARAGPATARGSPTPTQELQPWE